MSEGKPGPDRSRAESGDKVKVTDRRHFTSEGERRPGVEDEPGETAGPAATDGTSPRAPSGGAESRFEHSAVEDPSGVDFTMLINAMAQPALLFLGEVPNSSGERPEVHLEQARLYIDMLDLLRVKCRGNLTPEEETLLEDVLYRLRMLYVSFDRRSR